MKQFFFIFLLSLSVTTTFSQFHFGIRAGVNLNSIEWNHKVALDFKSLAALNGGIYSTISLGNKFLLIPELQFVTKGYEEDVRPLGGPGFIKFKINYLECPLLFNYSFIKNLSVEVGPSLAIKLEGYFLNDGNQKVKLNDAVQPVEFGLQGGLRFFCTKKISVIGRYNYGLTPASEYPVVDSNGSTVMVAKSYNRNIILTVAYQIK